MKKTMAVDGTDDFDSQQGNRKNEGKFHHSSTVSQEIGGGGGGYVSESKAEPHGFVRKVSINVQMFTKEPLKSFSAQARETGEINSG